MNIKIHSLDEYLSLGLRPSTVFGSADFLKLNEARAEKILAFSADDRAGIVFGLRDGVLSSPWSAPYMSVDVNKGDVGMDFIREFGEALRKELDANFTIKLVSPPEVYNGPEIPFLNGFRRPEDGIICDTTFDLSLDMVPDLTFWARDTRRNLRISQRYDLRLEKTDDIAECYGLIEAHHSSHGYPMAMTERMVADTAKILPVDFWILRLDGKAIAAAYCYKVRSDIVQIINTGDTPEGRKVFALTNLIYNLAIHYRKELTENESVVGAMLDYGPSSAHGVQNEGLARFKRAIGCRESFKYTLLTKSRSDDQS